MKKLLSYTLSAGMAILAATACAPEFTTGQNGITVKIANPDPGQPANVRLTVYDASIIRVEATPEDSFPERKSLIVTGKPDGDTFSVRKEGGFVVLTTNDLKVKVDRKGKITF